MTVVWCPILESSLCSCKRLGRAESNKWQYLSATWKTHKLHKVVLSKNTKKGRLHSSAENRLFYLWKETTFNLISDLFQTTLFLPTWYLLYVFVGLHHSFFYEQLLHCFCLFSITSDRLFCPCVGSHQGLITILQTSTAYDMWIKLHSNSEKLLNCAQSRYLCKKKCSSITLA